MAYPFFSLAKTHRTTPIDFRMTGKPWSGKRGLRVPR